MQTICRKQELEERIRPNELKPLKQSTKNKENKNTNKINYNSIGKDGLYTLYLSWLMKVI